MTRPHGCVVAVLVPVTFVCGGIVGGWIGAATATPDGEGAIYAPLPHHVAPSPDSASFRFAMVHDVIHERYPRHGPAFYQERERLAREKLSVLHPDSVTAFALTDDIAVGYDRKGRTDEAIALMRDKLKRHQTLGLQGRELYSSYANLGEFLVHGNLWAMMGDDVNARGRVGEGIDFIRKSMKVNPQAHFNLEEWQVVAFDQLADACSRPSLIRKFDLIGNRLDAEASAMCEAAHPRLIHTEDRGRPYRPDWPLQLSHLGRRGQSGVAVVDWPEGVDARQFVAEVGKESGPTDVNDGSRGKRAPFDEPALWLIGEWRHGSGPNPHYALCLGEIMLRVGQRYLAWNCYERATRMADQFWPTPDLQQFLRDHCKSRQAATEKSLPQKEVADLRPKFDSELAFGERYQHEYQDYEEAKIRAGANLSDEHFYDEFHATHEPIASKVGPEEWYAGTTQSQNMAAKFRALCLWGLFSGGACVLLFAIVMNLLPPRKGRSIANRHQLSQRLEPFRSDAGDAA
jgi:hypothetical protein